jgi:myo-inositol-1(or 4)-monophosphatase
LESGIRAKKLQKQAFNMSIDLNHVCDEVIRITREVGKFISHEQSRLGAQNIEEKGHNDFVTYVDKAAETLLVNELSAIVHDCGFITEEKTVEQESKEYNWVIDPIDGTTNFIHGLPLFSISIALMHNSDIVLGVVYEISHDECFYAIKGNGAFLNGVPIKVSNRKRIADSLIVTGFPYRFADRLDAWMALFVHFIKNTHGVRRLGSAAIDLAYVACGRFESFYEYGLSPWDVAAGGFIVQQAGGTVSDYSGTSDWVFGQELLAGNGLVNQEMLEVINEHFPKSVIVES